MGKAARWLKNLLGMKKDKENVRLNTNCVEKVEKKRWSFSKPAKISKAAMNIPLGESVWLKSYIADAEKEQSGKHAITVAAAAVDFTDREESAAAVKIQSVFRGHLARKALRALRGLVKLQAAVRGFLVRKHTNAAFHSMQALMRAQTVVRRQRARRSVSGDCRFQLETRSRKPVVLQERIDKNVLLIRNKRMSASFDHLPFEESPKIIEVDTFEPQSDHDGHHYYSIISSPVPFSVAGCLSTQQLDSDLAYYTENLKPATPHSTPRFSCSGNTSRAGTPARNSGESFFRRSDSNCPNYMANTLSSSAKARSHSAPRQRPRKDIMASRNSYSGARMLQSPCSKVDESFES